MSMLLYETNEYRATSQWPYAIAAGCLVYRKQADKIEVLLLEKHHDGKSSQSSFHLPKGHVEYTEPIEKTALRETEEETGCLVKLKTYVGSLHWKVLHPVHNVNVEKTTHYFIAEWQEDTSAMDGEYDQKHWVSVEEAEKLLGAPNPKGEDKIIRRFKNFLTLTSSRYA